VGKQTSQNAKDYWRANIKLLFGLLSIWFAVSFGFGILLREQLDAVQFFGFKLGFWFAQQGSIYVFVALIFVYARSMKRLEKRFGFED
jgi:putative solute:sodium symporter small subunit